MAEMQCTVQAPEDVDARADVVLGRRIPGLSRRVARQMALAGHLFVNGRSVPACTRVTLGDRLSLTFEPPTAAAGRPCEILRVSDDFVYVQKPAGIHVHRLRPDDPFTLADAVAREHPECAHASPDPREGGLVHRLDYETTGVVAFARHVAAWTQARAAFRRCAVTKLYLAVCDGEYPHGPPETSFVDRLETGHPIRLGPLTHSMATVGLRITAPIARHQRSVRVDAAGASAETMVWCLGNSHSGDTPGQKSPPRWLALLSLKSGRRHQARVHLAWFGSSILGDAAYGGTALVDGGVLLHAWGLDLSREISAESPVWAPLPPRFLRTLNDYGIPAPNAFDGA